MTKQAEAIASPAPSPAPAVRIRAILARVREFQRDVLKLERRMSRNDGERYEALEPEWIRLENILYDAQHGMRDAIVALHPKPPTPRRPDLEGFRGGYGVGFGDTHAVPWNLIRLDGDFYVVMDDDRDYHAYVKVLAIDRRAFIDFDAPENVAEGAGVRSTRKAVDS